MALIFLPGGAVPFLGTVLRRLTRRSAPTTVAHHVGDEPHAVEAPARRTVPDGPVVLRLDGVTVRFGGLKALEQASLTVRQGEVVAIIGPNGAGKTTLLNVLSGLIGGGRVDGEVDYGGKALLGARATTRRRYGIGRTFQHAEAFPELTVAENVLCTNRRITAEHRRRAAELITGMGLGDVADRRPTELPFGLQKRLDLARAVAERPALLLLDEPFGGLDAGERRLAANQIRKLRDEGSAVVIIDHVLDDLFAVADRVVAFDFGVRSRKASPTRSCWTPASAPPTSAPRAPAPSCPNRATGRRSG